MGGEAPDAAEDAGLLSQEQQMKRSQTERHLDVSKLKMYSMAATIVLLFFLLIASNTSDQRAFRGLVRRED